MRILITNDDGINAPGLIAMMNIATELAGSNGEVWTIAPAQERSGVGHCVSYTNPMLITKLSERRYAIEGNPADCVLAGLYHVMADKKPDLILSGVNRGNNSAENVLYSGTIGAAMEGALQGVPSFALSQYFGPKNAKLDDPFDASIVHGANVVRALLSAQPPERDDYRLFYNINFPPVPADQVLGQRIVRQGRRQGSNFSAHPHKTASGREFLFIQGGDQHVPADPDTDVQSNLEGYISVTPLRADMTAYDALDHLSMDT
jgi:5'-nucleotidase